MLNLITNGLDSVEPGGTVTVSIAIDGGRKRRLVVADNGCGMTEEVHEALVRAVFHAPPRRAGHRTSACRSAIESSKNTTGKSSPTATGPGKGSKFTVSLPLRQPATRQRPRETAAA